MDDMLPTEPLDPPALSACSAAAVVDPVPTEIHVLSVAEQLDLARAAHVRYRELHDRTMNSAEDDMAAAIRGARDARLAALALDPGQHDPAWRIDVFDGKAVSHDDLMIFYEAYLAAD